jgi:hypothetical protein
MDQISLLFLMIECVDGAERLFMFNASKVVALPPLNG